MLERLRFSIPISVAISAPADLVWDTLTDIESYPAIFDAVLTARPCYPYGGVSVNGSCRNPSSIQVVGGSSASSAAGACTNDGAPTTALKGSKWNITRISVVENQKYSAQVTITQCNQEENKRSFTMSTHQMLGATCSLKLSVEPVTAPPPNNHNNSLNVRSSNTQSVTISPLSQPPSPETDEVASRAPTSSSTACCQVTAIMTMIPYQMFVKLLGIMCCICLLERRARMAMECDLEDLVIICEKKHAIALTAARATKVAAAAAGEDHNQVWGSQEPTSVLLQQAENQSNANSSNYVFARGNQKDLQTILEENCSGC